jgi:hypothetical protein
LHISRHVAGILTVGRPSAQLRKRMPRKFVIKLTQRVLPWGLTKVRCKRMRWKWTSIYFPRRTDREAQRAKDKAERDAKKGGRSGKSKAVVASTPSLVLPEVSTASQSQNPCKRDSSCAQLSLSRL